MNGVKFAVKAIAATAAGALMLGATVAGAAFAANFGDFPKPYVNNGVFDGKIVVGANAMTADVVGAIGIAAALGQATVQLSDATGTGKATVSVISADGLKGDVVFDGALEDASGFVNPLRNSKFSALHDWSGDNALKYKDTSTTIKAHQELYLDNGLGGTNAKIGRGIGTNDKGLWKVYIPSDALEFKMVFDENFNQTTGDLVFDILGREVTLESYSGTASLTISSGKKYSVSLDNPTFTDTATGATVTFKGVSTDGGSAYVTVTNGGVTDTGVLTAGVEKTIAGIALKGSDLFRMSDTSMFGSITLGSKLSKTINSNDPFLDATEWTLKTIEQGGGNGVKSFTLQYNPSTAASLGPGEALSGLFGGFTVKNVGYLLKDSDYYNNLKVKQVDSQSVFTTCSATDAEAPGTGTLATKSALVLNWPKAYTAQVAGNDVSDAELYSNASATIVSYHQLSDGTYKCNWFDTSGWATLVTLNYGGTTTVTYDYKTGDTLSITVDKNPSADGTPILIDVTDTGDGFSKIGQGQGVATTVDTDLMYGGTGIGDKDYDYWTVYGVKIHDPKVSLPNGEVVFDVPNDQNKMTVIVGKETTVQESIAAGATGPLSKVTIDSITVEGAKTAIKLPISAPVAVLDTEISDAAAQNVILVGGPSVNSLVKKLGGAYADANSYKDVGKLYWIDSAFGGSKTAVVAAGWDAENTRAASYVLAHYDTNAAKLAGKTEVTVQGTDLTSLTVN